MVMNFSVFQWIMKKENYNSLTQTYTIHNSNYPQSNLALQKTLYNFCHVLNVIIWWNKIHQNHGVVQKTP